MKVRLGVSVCVCVLHIQYIHAVIGMDNKISYEIALTSVLNFCHRVSANHELLKPHQYALHANPMQMASWMPGCLKKTGQKTFL